MRPSRRETFALGASAAWMLLRSRGPSPPDPSIDELARSFRDTPRGEVLDVAARAIRSGASRETVLGAVFLAGVTDVRPRPHGILHCVMMVESVFQLAEAASTRESWLPVLWNLDDFKVSQERDRVEDGDWRLPPRPGEIPRNERAARRDLLAAMEERDPERADRAVVGLLPHHTHDSLFEVLWPLCIRCYAFIGHKTIHAAQMERVLRRIGPGPAEPALRSLVRTLLVESDTGDLARSIELGTELPRDGSKGTRREDGGREVLAALRTVDPADAQEAVVDAIRDGLAPETVWDGIRLLGSEIFLRRPGRTAASGRGALLPVHAVTVQNALSHVWRSARAESTRRLALLQAAAWTVRLRDDLARMVDLPLDGPRIDEGPQPSFPPGHTASLLDSLFRKAIEHHQHKYAAAMLEDASRASTGWRSRLLGAGIDYLRPPDAPDTEIHERSLRALRDAGVY